MSEQIPTTSSTEQLAMPVSSYYIDRSEYYALMKEAMDHAESEAQASLPIGPVAVKVGAKSGPLITEVNPLQFTPTETWTRPICIFLLGSALMMLTSYFYASHMTSRLPTLLTSDDAEEAALILFAEDVEYLRSSDRLFNSSSLFRSREDQRFTDALEQFNLVVRRHGPLLSTTKVLAPEYFHDESGGLVASVK